MSFSKTQAFEIAAALLVILIIGFIAAITVSGSNLNGKPLTIDPAFTSTVLAADSIIMGFWAVIIGLPRGDSKVTALDKQSMGKLFFASFAYLIFSVFSWGLQAIGIMSSPLAFTLIFLSFCATAIFLGLTIYLLVFYEESHALHDATP